MSKSKTVVKVRKADKVVTPCGQCGVVRDEECSRFECGKRRPITAAPMQESDSLRIGDGCYAKIRARGAD
jgi:cytidine deaminase